MGLIRQVASIMMLGGVSSHTRREPPGKAERARAKAERARGEPAGARRDTAAAAVARVEAGESSRKPGMAVSGC